MIRRNVSSSLEQNIISERHPSSSDNTSSTHDHSKQNNNRKSLHPHRVTALTVNRVPVQYLLGTVAFLIFLSYCTMTINYARTVLFENISYIKQHQEERLRPQQQLVSSSSTTSSNTVAILPGFASILQRALQHTKICTDLQPVRPFDTRSILPFHNDTVASLPAFGIINAIQSYQSYSGDQASSTGSSTTIASATSRRTTSTNSREDEETDVWPICNMPPTTECNETQLSVVFMAYNPDRLGITLTEIKRMFDPNIFFHLVKEVILVWNGERHIDESESGRTFLEYASTHPIRIVYPLKMGFPNDLMNRYHPKVVQPTTKALLYYDDDGPFYPYPAIQGGFELWKRHSQAQIGAMARQIIYSTRQQEYKVSLLGAETTKKTKPADNVFVSHCTNVDDEVDYEFHFFANYDANMVLPSGSLLHSNYLCYLWHPIFDEIRRFVLLHPVHPDDMTVSMIVSQLAGVAPRVYSRRLDRIPPEKGGRRLTEQYTDEASDFDESPDMGIVPLSELQRHRSLMFSICWDCGAGMTEMKQYWAELRTEAVNALVRYFGSINSGSIGWCTTDSEYYNANKDGRCWPTMAKQGMLPWMNTDGSPKTTCP